MASYGADSGNGEERDLSVLTYAAFFGQVEFARRLLEKKDINNVIIAGRKPLIWAAFNRHFEMARLFIREGAEVDGSDKYGSTALMAAAWSGDARIARLLLESGADPSIKNNRGEDAYDIAKGRGLKSREIAELLPRGRTEKELLRSGAILKRLKRAAPDRQRIG